MRQTDDGVMRREVFEVACLLQQQGFLLPYRLALAVVLGAHFQMVEDALHHLDCVEGLGDEVTRAGGERSLARGIVDLRGEDDHRQIIVGR